MSSQLEELKAYLKEMEYYDRVTTLIHWDMDISTPKLGRAGHIDALTYFSGRQFAMETDERLGDLLDVLNTEQEYEALDDMWKFIVRRMKRNFDRRRRIPADFYENFVRAQAEAGNAWKEAKNASDFSLFAPHLEKLIAMTKEMTGYTDSGREIYDALLDEYEEGMDSETIDRLFGQLKDALVPLVQQITAKPQPENPAFHASFDVDAQRRVQRMLLTYIGFREDAGAVGETEHPYTTNFSSQDVRVTNHFYEHDPINAIFSAIHEGGHGIFEQNVNPDYDGTIASGCIHMGIHESQSRFYENILGRRKSFWLPIYEKMGKLLPEFAEIPLDDFCREINHVQNSFIRTEADEVTYCLHIILRYEMEKAIFRDNVPVEALPGLWNRKMQEYLHITPQNDAEGILQDMHWSGGMFGYFPSYLLGTIYDGMFLEVIEEQLGAVDELLENGKIGEITAWLNEHIHRYGSTRTPKEVIAAVCGKEVTAEPIIRYFREKYTEIYHL